MERRRQYPHNFFFCSSSYHLVVIEFGQIRFTEVYGKNGLWILVLQKLIETVTPVLSKLWNFFMFCRSCMRGEGQTARSSEIDN